MQFLLAFSLISMAVACHKDEELPNAAEVKFQINEDQPAAAEPKDWRYAKYKFSLTDYNDVAVAVRVAVDEDNHATTLEVKDLTTGREARAVETAALTGTMSSDGGTYNFEGTSELQEGGTDYGGTYTGSITITDNAVAADGCCGEMTFQPTKGQQTDKELAFTGVKVEETFTEDEWHAIVTPPPSVSVPTSGTCEDYKLVLSGLKSVKRLEKFDFTVALQTCDDQATTDFAGTEVGLQLSFDGGATWSDSTFTGKSLDANGSYLYKNVSFVIDKKNSQSSYQYKTSVTIDHDKDESESTADKTYAVVSEKFDLNPATSAPGSCPDNKYSLEVIKQPQDTTADSGYVIEVALQCDGTHVTDPKKDKAASAPVTLLQFKQDAKNWKDSTNIKGALKAGKRVFKPTFLGTATLQYKIGVTINDTQYTVETHEFNITEE